MAPLIHGGAQERGRRAGTGNVIGALGLAMAIEYAEEHRESEAARLQQLRDELEEQVKKSRGPKLWPRRSSGCNTTTLVFEGIGDPLFMPAGPVGHRLFIRQRLCQRLQGVPRHTFYRYVPPKKHRTANLNGSLYSRSHIGQIHHGKHSFRPKQLRFQAK